MARKRMFDLEIINQDSFFDLPMDTKALYFLLGMEADDEGFVSPKKVLRLYGGTEDSLKVLIAKEYIIPFETGVIVITDWKRNNYIDKNKSKPTIYQQEKAQISYDENTQKYVSLEKVKPKLNESLEKVYTDKNRIDKNRIAENSINICANEFARVWKMYPNKKGKTSAYKSFCKALKEGVSIETIIDGIKRYNQYIELEKIDIKYVKNGSTWFNQKCWEDDYTIKRKLTTKDIASKINIEEFLKQGVNRNE